jgi:hypothetical protein
VPWPLKHGQDRISEPIPFGVFEYPNELGGPKVNYVDEMLRTEAGGVIVTSTRQWNGVKVPVKWVAENWPSAEDLGSPVEISVSGVPGRPTSKHLILVELERRAAAGALLESCAKEADYLSSWLGANHPSAPQLKPTSAENAIRDDYRRLKPIKLSH